MLGFQALQTPADDGAVLIEPPVEHLPYLLSENRARFTRMTGGIGALSWADLRHHARRVLGVTDDAPIVMTGHQPEFMHAGVWAKYVVTSALARSAGARAINLVVDNDVPKTLSIAVPVASTDGVQVRPVAVCDAPAGRPYEFLPRVEPTDLQRVRDALAAALGPAYEASCAPVYLAGMASAEGDFVEQTVAGRRGVEAAFGVTVEDVRVSRAWGGPMLLDWIARAAEFAAAYNAALADYRREQHVRNADRPIPDLRVAGGRVELPLWAYRAGEARRRVFVERAGGDARLFADAEPIGAVSQAVLRDADACRLVLRPRALALTLWARLLASDLFIHGIGGAKYDRITDAIVRRYYGVEPPAMVCVSATLRLPVETPRTSDAEIGAAKRWVRDVQYQPDRWAGGVAGAEPLLADRRAAIERSRQLRPEGSQRSDRAARRATFDRIRTCNARILALKPSVLDDAQRRVELLEHVRARQRIADGREYFFALMPCEKLWELCERLRQG